LDEFGWVQKLDDGCFAESMLCTISGGHYPADTYTVFYESEGQLDFGKNAKVKEARPGRILIDVDSSKGGFSVGFSTAQPIMFSQRYVGVHPGARNRIGAVRTLQSAEATDLKRAQNVVDAYYQRFMIRTAYFFPLSCGTITVTNCVAVLPLMSVQLIVMV
jgi:hypothetical protein